MKRPNGADRRRGFEPEHDAAELGKLVGLLRESLTLLSPSPAFAGDLERLLQDQWPVPHRVTFWDRLRGYPPASVPRPFPWLRPEAPSWAAPARPVLVGAAVLSLAGAALYVWGRRSLA